MSAALKLGTIGAGIMGRRLIEAAFGHAGSPLRPQAAYDPDPLVRERLRASLPGVQVCDTAEALIGGCDVVHIASPPSTHLAHLNAIVAAGKACLCEKPLAVDVGSARVSVERAEARGARVAVNFPFASSLAVETLGRWIGDGGLGRIESVEIELSFAAWPRPWQADAAGWLDGRAQGGFLREVGSHFLFLARRLFGPLQLVEARVAYPTETAAHVASAAGGFVAPPPAVTARSERMVEAKLIAGPVSVALVGSVGTTSKADHNIFLIRGSKGEVRLCDWSVAERKGEDGGWRAAPDALPNDQARMINLGRQLDKLAALARGEPTDLATLSEALDVQIAVEAILAAGR